MVNPSEFPIALVFIDYILGVVMWTLVARGVFDLFAAENEMVLFVVFRKVTNPVIKLVDKITPGFLVKFLVPIYVAWWFYMIRFYVIPLIFFGQMGILSFPLESDISKLLLNIGL